MTGIAVGWTNTTKLEIHKFTSAKRTSLPEYLSSSFGLPGQTLKEKPSFYEIFILYPISCLAVSKNSLLLAVGLQ